jgi:diketogulonate reductase-like aldo/keto reductase
MTIDRGQPSVRLGQAGSMPLVGLGTWQMTGARCQAAVRSALEVGYRHIDTAVVLEGSARSRTATCATRCWPRSPPVTG